MINTVYLIDPDAVFKLGLGQLFSEKYQVEVVGYSSDAKTAEAELATLTPDLLIVDPGSRVYEFIPYLRKFASREHVSKVALLCERLSATAIREVRGLALDAYAMKPVPINDMYRMMEAILSDRIYIGPGFEELGLIPETARPVNKCDSSKDRTGHLSDRETQILVRTVNGKTAADIAREFEISIKTAEWHRRNVFSKLQVKNVAQLTKYALRTGIIALD
jgi:DNA-binding NarL/FixJ family response regulator